MARCVNKPLVWLPACHRNLDLDDPGGYIVLADRYASAVGELDLQPVLFDIGGKPREFIIAHQRKDIGNRMEVHKI